MGIEIALISDVKLQKLATKADDGNGQLETSEISDLLVNMAKKKYNYDDFKQILGLDSTPRSNEEMAELYTDCLNKLSSSMGIAESMQRDKLEAQKEAFGKDQKTLVASATAVGLGFGLNTILKTGIKSAGKIALKLLGGAAIGAGLGLALTGVAYAADKLISKEQTARLESKDDFMENLKRELQNLGISKAEEAE